MSTARTALLTAAGVVIGISSAAASGPAMRAALERGDIDEASRQGMLAGIGVVEEALGAKERTTRLAALTAVPHVEGRAELLPMLADIAAGPDRRMAMPATRTALTVARELAQTTPADDLAPEEIAAWRDGWAAVALDPARWIEVRVRALDIAVALDAATVLAVGATTTTAGLGMDPATALGDPDPAFRVAVLQSLPLPVPESTRSVVEGLAKDRDPSVARAAAIALCESPKKCPARRR